MSPQRQFEGHDARALLDKVCATYGPEPSIAKAETFRSGGVLGFFQREHYRLVVDEPAARRPAATPARPAPAVVAPPPAPPAARLQPAKGAGLGLAAYVGGAKGSRPPASGHGRADAFAELADATVDSNLVAAGARPAGAPAPVPAPVPATGPAPAKAGVIKAGTAKAGGAKASPVPAGAPGRGPAVAGAQGESFESVLRGVAALVEAAPVPAEGTDVVAADYLETRPEPVPERAPEPAAKARPAARPGRDTLALRQALSRSGLNRRSAKRVESALANGQPLSAALLTVFESLPAAPRVPERPGSLVAVVGPGRRAMSEASRLAAESGVDPAGVAYATCRPSRLYMPEQLMVDNADDAAELARAHRRGRVGFMAVEAPIGGPATAWACHILNALKPNLVVGVVDAALKVEDVAAWIEGLEGLDSLVLDNPDRTSSPASVLDLCVPVARIGSEPATAARWAAVVMDRVGSILGRPARWA